MTHLLLAYHFIILIIIFCLSDCPNNFVKLETGCYLFAHEEARDWYQSETYCEDQNAHLVVIETEHEQEVLRNKMLTMTHSGEHVIS